jgi:hypothetical protein
MAVMRGGTGAVELSASSSMPAQATQGRLRVGAARIDITPENPVALQGYENPENRVSDGVHDRLYARAFAFASGARRLVLVSADVGSSILGPYFLRAIADRHGLAPGELFLCDIHTHSGPQLSLSPSYPHPNNSAYTRLVEQRLVTLVGKALADLAPAQLAVGRGTSTVGGSRRKPTADGRTEMAFNPDGPADHEVMVLEFSRPGGKVIGAIFNYACHSRSLRSPNRRVSGDVLGIAEQLVEAKRPAPFVGAAFPGASADIDPVTLADGFEPTGAGIPPAPVRLGEQLGEDVLGALRESRAVDAAGGIRSATRRVMLPAKSATEAPRPVNIIVAAVGPVAFVGLDVEASVEIGLALKASSPFKDTFVFTICNGWAGYLPVAHQYAEGGYEVAHTSYGPKAADLVVKEALAVLASVK